MEIGSIIVAFGPAAMYLLLIYDAPQLFIVFIASSFFFLVAQMFAGVVWVVVFPLRTVLAFQLVVRVAFVEASRFFYLKLYKFTEEGFTVKQTEAKLFPLQDVSTAGLGFGAMDTVSLYGLILSHSTDPATLYSANCPQMSTFTLVAWLSLLFQMLHILLMILAKDAYRRASVPRAVCMLGLHLAATLLTLLAGRRNGCLALLPAEGFVVVLAGLMLAVIVRQKEYRSYMRGIGAFELLFGSVAEGRAAVPRMSATSI
mmetsp:Transcript_3095/g.5741  ORF Transcript_3095/g.5741 Transcript_3095/m.5741 type:complete len:258 (-) Transcript_3095:16-789(-)